MTAHNDLIDLIEAKTRESARAVATQVMRALNELELGQPGRLLQYARLHRPPGRDHDPSADPAMNAVIDQLLMVGQSAIYDEIDAFPASVRDQIATRDISPLPEDGVHEG